MIVTEAEYRDMCEQCMGYCTECQDFTRECTEPDAEGYDCSVCGRLTVCGTDNALIKGYVKVI